MFKSTLIRSDGRLTPIVRKTPVRYGAHTTSGVGTSYGSIVTNAAYNGLSDFTLEAWVKLPSGFTDQYGRIIDHDYSTGFALCRYSNNTQMNFQVNGGNFVQSGTFPSNTWVHIACKRTGTTLKILINGALDVTQTGSGSALNSGVGIYTGVNRTTNVGNEKTAVRIAYLRLWNLARSDADIGTAYTQRLMGNESGLIGCWPFGNLSLVDISPTNNSLVLNGDASVVYDDPLG